MLLQPTSPFTRPLDYEKATELMMERKANAVVGMRETDVKSVFVGTIDDAGRIGDIVDRIRNLPTHRRQDFPKEYTANGAVFLFKWEFFKQYGKVYQDSLNTYGYMMDPYYSVDIDELIDLQWADFLIERGFVDMSYWR
jgi:CMP-N-acetylneuraminic acid synthetase